MSRVHWFEFGDLDWFPKWLRREGLELLASMEKMMGTYEQSADVIKRQQPTQVIVLGAGSGGGVPDLGPTKIILTDIFPDKDYKNSKGISYEQTPVDALKVAPNLKGMRVMYTAFHHFKPAQAKKILEDAVKANEPIAIFETTERSIRGIAMILAMPFLIFLITPLVKPFRWTRLLTTYVIPLIPIFVLHDGIVSALRTYKKQELENLTRDLTTYEWSYETLKTKTGIEPVSAFTGRPKMVQRSVQIHQEN